MKPQLHSTETDDATIAEFTGELTAKHVQKIASLFRQVKGSSVEILIRPAAIDLVFIQMLLVYACQQQARGEKLAIKTILKESDHRLMLHAGLKTFLNLKDTTVNP